MATVMDSRPERSADQLGKFPTSEVCNVEPVTAAELREFFTGAGLLDEPEPRWTLAEASDGWTLTEGGQQ